MAVVLEAVFMCTVITIAVCFCTVAKHATNRNHCVLWQANQ